jgi:hypothetical protein
MISESRKAIVAFLLAFLGPIGVLLAATDQELNVRNVLASLVAGVIAGLATYFTTNAQPPAGPGNVQ